jgi:hypothetical protein
LLRVAREIPLGVQLFVGPLVTLGMKGFEWSGRWKKNEFKRIVAGFTIVHFVVAFFFLAAIPSNKPMISPAPAHPAPI